MRGRSKRKKTYIFFIVILIVFAGLFYTFGNYYLSNKSEGNLNQQLPEPSPDVNKNLIPPEETQAVNDSKPDKGENLADKQPVSSDNLITDNSYGIFMNYLSQAENKAKSMTLEEKIGQLFLVRCPKEGALDMITNLHPGGFVMFSNDFSGKTRNEVVNNIKGFQEKSGIPMIIAVDEEGGDVVRVSSNKALSDHRFKSPQSLYKNGGFSAVRKDAIDKSALLKSLGINLNLAPVADVSTNPSDYIFKRSFGKNADKTSEYVKTVVKAIKEENMSCALKHFPGYGNNADTHTGSSIDKRDMDVFLNSDFLPFKAGIKQGAECVLVSHNIVTCMDKNNPASLSKNVHDILRNELSFTGVIMTDDLSMEAVKNASGSPNAVLAIKAGNDMMIITDFKAGYDAVMSAISKGNITESQINKSVVRILAWKYSMGLM